MKFNTIKYKFEKLCVARFFNFSPAHIKKSSTYLTSVRIHVKKSVSFCFRNLFNYMKSL